MDTDEKVLCASAWNDNGSAALAKDNKKVSVYFFLFNNSASIRAEVQLIYRTVVSFLLQPFFSKRSYCLYCTGLPDLYISFTAFTLE